MSSRENVSILSYLWLPCKVRLSQYIPNHYPKRESELQCWSRRDDAREAVNNSRINRQWIIVCLISSKHSGSNNTWKRATRGDNLLDVVATHPSLVVRNVRVDEAGMVSDHRLVIATLQLPVVPVVPAVPIASRHINGIDLEEFQASTVIALHEPLGDCGWVRSTDLRGGHARTGQGRSTENISSSAIETHHEIPLSSRQVSKTWKTSSRTYLEIDPAGIRPCCLPKILPNCQSPDKRVSEGFHAWPTGRFHWFKTTMTIGQEHVALDELLE